MDIHRLIMEVQRRPALWDTSHPDHSNRVETKRLWESVAFVLGLRSESTSSARHQRSRRQVEARQMSRTHTHTLTYLLSLSLSLCFCLLLPHLTQSMSVAASGRIYVVAIAGYRNNNNRQLPHLPPHSGPT